MGRQSGVDSRSSRLVTGVETTHWNLTTMQTIFSVAMEKLSPEEQDKALALLPFSRETVLQRYFASSRSWKWLLHRRHLWSRTVRTSACVRADTAD